MSLFYDENEEMRTFHEGYGAGLVALLGQAMQVYAHRNLSSASRTAAQPAQEGGLRPDGAA
jgi:hypothetical protein